jgi:hypothetical protein
MERRTVSDSAIDDRMNRFDRPKTTRRCRSHDGMINRELKEGKSLNYYNFTVFFVTLFMISVYGFSRFALFIVIGISLNSLTQRIIKLNSDLFNG